LLFSAGIYEVGPFHFVQHTQLLRHCWKRLLTSSVQKSTNGAYDCFLNCVFILKSSSLQCQFAFQSRERSQREPDLRNIGGAGEHTCHYLPEISAETKQSECGYLQWSNQCLQCNTCQVLCAAYHSLDIKCLYWSVQRLFLYI